MSVNKNTRLGTNPLDWIGRDLVLNNSNTESKNPPKEEVKTESPIKKTKEETVKKKAEKNTEKSKYIPYTTLMEVETIKKIKDYAYWQRIKNKDVIKMALDQFFADKEK